MLFVKHISSVHLNELTVLKEILNFFNKKKIRNEQNIFAAEVFCVPSFKRTDIFFKYIHKKNFPRNRFSFQ